jgi:hypothetical protein
MTLCIHTAALTRADYNATAMTGQAAIFIAEEAC